MKNIKIIPPLIVKGDNFRVIAPSRSLSVIGNDTIYNAENYLRQRGFEVSYGKNVFVRNEFDSSSVDERLSDLHEAFADPKVNAIITSIGGFNSNQLLDYIDYDLIRMNPKFFCGYSDIAALSNAIYSKTGLITYYGPHFSTLGIRENNEYTAEHFIEMAISDSAIDVNPSSKWSNDAWYLDQENRSFINNEGYWVINSGEAEGCIIGGNLNTFIILKGTRYMPSLDNSILIFENNSQCFAEIFDRDLHSFIHDDNFKNVKAIIIGRFEIESNITRNKLERIVKSKNELRYIPVIANVDFGHTNPILTIPIGGICNVKASDNKVSIKISK